MIEGEHNSSNEDMQSDDSINLAQLRKKLELSNMQLLELTYNDDKFMNCIDDLNSNGVACVQDQNYREALIYFNENQKILEYAASCGKTIDRSVIIATLHNQACVNQKLWELEKSANYLQAIIYNINTHLISTQAKIGELTTLEGKQQKQIDSIAGFIKKKEAYALYKLQFCAVNSQIRKHQVSIQSARGSIAIMKEVCRLCLFMNKQIKKNTQITQNMRISSETGPILQNLIKLQENLELKNYEKYLDTVKDILKNKSRNLEDPNLINKFKYLRTFSIGKLMQLSPLMIKDFGFKENIFQLLLDQNIITKALYLGISYFTVGTEMRFIASKENDENSEDYRHSNAFLLSSVYHIYAIMIVLTYVPVDTIFLNHLLSSFNNHYFIDLQKNSDGSEEEEQNYEQFNPQNQIDQLRRQKFQDENELAELNSKSSVEERNGSDFNNDIKKMISPIAKKIDETGVKKINKLEGLLTESINRSEQSIKKEKDSKNNSEPVGQGRISQKLKRNSQEDERSNSKNQVKKHFFRNKSPNSKKSRLKNKDKKQSTTALGSKRSVTGTTANHFNSNEISKGKSQELSKKKRKKDVFSIYSPMTVDDQLEATRQKKDFQKQRVKEERTSRSKKPRKSHSKQKKKMCIYTYRDKRDRKQAISLVKQTKSKDQKKSKSKSLGKNGEMRKKKTNVQLKGVQQINSLIKKTNGDHEKPSNHNSNQKGPIHLNEEKSKEKDGERQKNGMHSKPKQKLKNIRQSGNMKMNKVEGKKKFQKHHSKGK